jgi:hypothetical protein
MSVVRRSLSVNTSVVSAQLDGEAVLLNVESGVYFGLDSIGTRIWELLSTGASETEIFDRLLDEYDVDAPQLRADLDAFLDVLLSKSLVRAAQA